MEIEVQYLIKNYNEKHKDQWDAFCWAEDEISFWYTSDRLTHVITVGGASALNRSFLVRNDKEILAIIPFIITTNSNGLRVADYSGWGTPVPVVSSSISSSKKLKLIREIFKEIESISYELEIDYILFSNFYPKGEKKKRYKYYNELIEFEYMDATIYTTVLDVQKNSVSEIFQLMRDNHKRDIKKYIDSVNCSFISGSTTSPKDVDLEVNLFKDFYFKVAKKATHPDMVFTIFSKMITDKNAVLVKVLYEEKVSAYLLLITYKQHAYYLLGGQNDKSLPLIKTAIFKSFSYLKQIGICSFEIGRMEFDSSIFYKTDEKRKKISFFKKGFGAPIVPIFQGIKFFNRKALIKMVNSYADIAFIEKSNI